MFKKIASLVIAATMLVATASFAVSAAETDEVAVAAAEDSAVGADSSSEVGADSSSEVGADSSSEVGAGNTVSFDVKKSGWNNVKIMYCHVWKADGSSTSAGSSWPVWQSKAEKCDYDANTGIATYDLSKTGHNFSTSDGKIYCVIFSANTGIQSYNAIMSGKCIGDTLYCTGEQIENPEDSEKKANVAVWTNNPDCGPEKKITSKGNIVGSAYPDGENDVTLLAQYLIAYYNDPAKTDLTQNLLDTLKVSPVDVMGVVSDRVGADDADGKKAAVEKILAGCTDPTTGKKTDTTKLESAKSGGSNAASGSSGSGSGSSGSGSGSGSSSVRSGQETTILFVLGGVMLAAAGVVFLSRKKREE